MSSAVEGIQTSDLSRSSATIRLDPRMYSREAILRASYWQSGNAYIHIPESPEDSFTVQIRLKETKPTLENPRPITIDEIVGEFCNSLIDFELRRQVEAETAPLRQLILAKAFSESGVLEDDPPGSIADPVEATKPSSLVKIISRQK